MNILFFITFKYYQFRRRLQLWKNKINFNHPLKLQSEFMKEYCDRNLIYEDVYSFLESPRRKSKNFSQLQKEFDDISFHLSELLKIFDGKYYQCGGLDVEAEVLFALLNGYDRASVVEIGVANGFSSRYVFEAAQSKMHSVVSIDLPRFSSQALTLRQKVIAKASQLGWLKDTGTIQDLREGGVIPREAFASWMVPASLKLRVPHTSFVGDVFNILPHIGSNFDIIIIDAMKEYSLRKKILEISYKKLRPNGVILFDGYWVNSAFEDFCRENHIDVIFFGKIGVLRKRV